MEPRDGQDHHLPSLEGSRSGVSALHGQAAVERTVAMAMRLP
jgi:hypothetical protein